MTLKSKIKQLSFEGLIVSTGKFAGALGSLFIVYILTNNLSPDEYGILNLAMTFSIIINQLLIGPFGAGSIRFFAASVEHKEPNRYVAIIFKIIRKINILIAIIGIFLIVAVSFMKTEVDWTYSIIAVVLFTIGSSYYSIFTGLFLALKKQVTVSLFQGLEPWVKAIFAFICILIFGGSGLIALVGYVIGIAIIAITQKSLFAKIKFEDDSEQRDEVGWEKRVLNYSYPFVIWGVFTAVHLVSDRWVLKTFATLSDVGMYSVVYQLGYFPVILIMSVLVQVITPYFYQMAGIGLDVQRMQKVRSVCKYLLIIPLVLTCFIALALYIMQGFIFTYIVSPEYAQVGYLLPYISIAAGLFATGEATTLILQSESKSSILIRPKVFTAILGVILNAIGGITFGIKGIVFALIIYALIYVLWIQRLINISSKESK